jgi:prepilin-type N-terminal cleavage/methylation domain-containing protein
VTRRSTGESGFTLIELSIVLLIVAILARFAVPQLRSLSSAELTAATRRISNATRYLYEEAALRGTVYSLNLDLDRQQYWVAKLDPETGELVEDTDLLAQRVSLPPDVRIADVVVPGAGKRAQGTATTRFYPEGYADRGIIHLMDDAGRATTVRIDPIRGRGEVFDGYHDFEARP